MLIYSKGTKSHHNRATKRPRLATPIFQCSDSAASFLQHFPARRVFEAFTESDVSCDKGVKVWA
ncbi:hypothetical protein GCM10009621_13720 [Corynebacterium felinum]